MKQKFKALFDAGGGIKQSGRWLLALVAMVASVNLMAETVTYSASAMSNKVWTISTSGTAPTGSSVSCSQTYSNAFGQATAGNSFTMTLSNFSANVTKLTFSLHSNSKDGKGNVSYSVDGGSEVFLVGTSSNSDVTFNSWGDNTSYGSDYRNVNFDITISPASSLVINVRCVSKNSIYFNGLTVTYSQNDPSGKDVSIEADDELNLTSEESDGTINVTYGEDVDEKDITLYADAECKTKFTGDWFTADFDASGNVEYVADANTGAAREAYIEIYVIADDTETDNTKVIKVTQEEYKEPTGTFAKFTGDIEEGDYVIVSTNALSNTTNSNRIASQSVTISNDKIVNPDEAIIWHIAARGDYWTLYNAAVEKYAGGTTTKNQGALLTEVTDYAKWTITESNNTYEFENLGRANGSSDTDNKWLRYNSGNAENSRWACYSTSTGSALTLYKKEVPAVYSAITVDDNIENGSVNVTGAADLTSVASGTEITLSNTPASGYKLDAYDVYKTGESSTKVTVTDGKFKMPAYAVTVSATFKSARTLTGIDINTDAVKKEYWVGDAFTSEGLVVTAHFDGADDADVTEDAVITGYDMATAGDQTVTVSFTEGKTTKSATYGIKVKAIENTKETAYTVTEAIALIDANPTGLSTANVYVKGAVSQVDNFNSKYSSITYWLDNNTFEVYSGKGLDNTDFTSIDDVAVGAEVIVYGVIKKFVKDGSPDVYEFDMNNYLVSYIAPENPKTTATITLSDYVTSLATDEAADEVTITYNGDGELSATSSKTDVATAAIVEGKLVVTPVAAGSATITVSAPETDEYTAATKSYNLTITAGLTAAALPFTFDGGKNDINPANGIKADGLANDYSASPRLKFDGEGDYVLVKIASKAAQVSYKIKGAPGSGDWAGQFDVLESADGTAYTTVASHETLATSAETKTHDLLEGTRYIKFVLTTKDNGNVGLGAINIVATKPKVDPEFSIANVDVVVEETAELQINTNSTGTISYTIDPADEGKLKVEEGIVYAYEEGEYTVTANITETETYNAAQTTFTVTVSTIDYKTAEVSTFTAVDGGLLELGQFHSYKGDAGTAPAVNNGQIRLYQGGGYITISALPGLKIAKIDITTAMATSYNYKVDDAEDYILEEAASLAANATANIAGLTADSVRIYCLGTDKNSRFYVSYLKVYYTGELETVSALAVADAEVTEYEIGGTVDHAGAVVTATFENAGAVDVTLNSVFTDPDMSTSGTKQVTAKFAEQTATYDITVAAETSEITVDVTEVPFGTVAQNATIDAKTVAVTLKAIAEATVAVTGDVDAFDVTPASLTESDNITITPVTTTAGEFTATITISADGAESKTVTATMNVAEVTTYTLVTNVNQLAAGDIVVMAATYGDKTYVNGDLSGDLLTCVEATLTDVLSVAGACEFTLAGGEGAWTLTSATGTLGATTVKKLTYDNTKTNFVDTWTISISDNVATIAPDAEGYGRFMYNHNNGGNRFLTYTSNTSATMLLPQLYKKEQTSEVVRTGLTSGKYGTICLNKKVTDFEGAEFYSIVGYQGDQSNPTGIVIESVEGNLIAGTPYIFLAKGSEIKVTYDGEAALTAGSANGLIGSFKERELTTEDGDVYGIKDNALRKLYTGEDGGNKVGANRAYINMSQMSPSEEAPAPAPGVHRVIMNNSSYSAPTNLNDLNGNVKAQKVMKDGQFYIIRDTKMYNAQGIEVQ